MSHIDSVDRLIEMKWVLVEAIHRESCPQELQLYRQAYDQVMRLLEPDIREFWNERAAICEFEGKVSKKYSEELALRDTCLHFGFRDVAFEEHARNGLQRLNELLDLITPQRSQLLIELDRICSAPLAEAVVPQATQEPDETDVLEFWRERSAILECEAGNTRMQAEVIARRETSLHFGFCCIAIVQRERQRLEVVRQLAALPGVRTGRQMQTAGR